VVDELLGGSRDVIKTCQSLAARNGRDGATLMGDGSVVLI